MISFQYLKVARQLDGYGEVVFPHCACDSRKDGHVIAEIGFECFKLHACKNDGTPEVRCSCCSQQLVNRPSFCQKS